MWNRGAVFAPGATIPDALALACGIPLEADSVPIVPLELKPGDIDAVPLVEVDADSVSPVLEAEDSPIDAVLPLQKWRISSVAAKLYLVICR